MTINDRMQLARLVCSLGHALRERTGLRVRQPLAELRFACAQPEQRAAIQGHADIIQEELNVKAVTGCDHLDDLVSYNYKPNLKTLGPKYGKGLGEISKTLATIDDKTLAPLRRGSSVTLHIAGTDYILRPEDVMASTQQAADWASADESGVQIALSTKLTPDLVREGVVRDFVRQIQQLRKDAGLEIEDRICIYSPDLFADWRDYVLSESGADDIREGDVVRIDPR